VLVMARQMDLPVFAGDLARLLHKDRGVVALGQSFLPRELGVAKAKAKTQSTRFVEQCSRRGARHLRLEERVDLGLLGEEPTRKKRRQRQLGEHDQLRAHALGLSKMRDQPFDDLRARLGARDGAELGGGDGQISGHEGSFTRQARESRRSAPWRPRRCPRTR
jgi:hypothetical protein